MASAAASQVLQGEKVNLKTVISLSILSFNLHYYHFTLDDSTKLFKKVPALQTIIFFSHFHILFHPKQFSLASLLPIPPPTTFSVLASSDTFLGSAKLLLSRNNFF